MTRSSSPALPRKRLGLGCGLVWVLTLIQCGIPAAQASAFPATLQLAELDGTNGFKLDGETVNDGSGGAVSAAGDVNGDEIDDLIVGASNADANGNFSGRSYVVFGSNEGFPATLQLSSLDGTNGFKLDGEESSNAGQSLSAAGDVNGDGLDDLIVGAPSASPNGYTSGRSYVVFGRNDGFPATLPLSDLDGINGFKLDGETATDLSGLSVSAAGDINGDGIHDLIVGAPNAGPNGNFSDDPGRSYVVFGRNDGFPATLPLADLDGTNGFKLDGEAIQDGCCKVSAAGDINDDSIDDLILGAAAADPNGNGSGRSYVVFGRNTEFPATVPLSGLDGTNGFKLDGEAALHFSGGKVSTAGDINGDGFDDLMLTAQNIDIDAHPDAGRSYVVFGHNDGFPATLQLSSLDGTNGFKLDGELFFVGKCCSISTAGDINGDGFDDLIMGAEGVSPNGNGIYSGRSYVVFGRNEGFPAMLPLSGLDGTTGFKLEGEAEGDYSGKSVSAAGDINGDGIDDVIVGAPNAGPNGQSSGRSYVVFGRISPEIFRDGFED